MASEGKDGLDMTAGNTSPGYLYDDCNVNGCG